MRFEIDKKRASFDKKRECSFLIDLSVLYGDSEQTKQIRILSALSVF